ncbi:MAG: peptidylprolyl isomerase [Xanthomonadales bacterium]|nr:peptidylprolyl isomerase [Xanthomonadales bacterium]
MRLNTPVMAAILVCLLMAGPLGAQDLMREKPVDKNDPNVVFAWQGDAVLTQEGIDAAFNKIPAEHRMIFIRDGGKVDKMVRNIMRSEVLALDAIENGYDQDPLVRERMIQAAHKELADAWIEQIRASAPEADYEAMAYEDYLAHPEKYQTDVILDVTHILIGTESRSDEAALALAQDVRQQALDNPESFADLVMEYSDDPAKERNQGTYLRMRPGQMATAFEEAAYALTEAGEISSPVKTDYGYHIIRLDNRYPPRQRSFEEVRKEAVAQMKLEHETRYQQNYIRGVLADGIVLPEGSVEVMLKRHFGENLENAPQY